MLARTRLLNHQTLPFRLSPPLLSPPPSALSFPRSLRTAAGDAPGAPPLKRPPAARRSPARPPSSPEIFRPGLFVPPGVERNDVTVEMVLPCSNIVAGPYAGDARIKQVEFVKSSPRAKDCPKDDRPEFAIIGRSNVGKSSLINSLVRKKDFALTSKTPGKTQLINHFLVDKSWYIVDLPGYGFANAPESARNDWSSFTKGYFLNRSTLVAVLLLVDASIPPQKIDLDCANWLGRNNIGNTFVFTKCDKTKGGKGSRPEDNVKQFLDLIATYYQEPPPWIMTSSVNGLGRDELLLHMSQLRNYWDHRQLEAVEGEDYDSPRTEQCAMIFSVIDKFISENNKPHILEPKCAVILSETKGKIGNRRSLNENNTNLLVPPARPDITCRTYAIYLLYSWANNDHTREALNIKKGTVGEWNRCNIDIHNFIVYKKDIWSSLKYHLSITKKGYRALVYSGDHDMIIPFLGTQAWIRSLNFSIVDDWRSWRFGGQVAGYTRTYANNMTFATVKGAGHTAPEYRPKECLAMFHRWISFKPL